MTKELKDSGTRITSPTGGMKEEQSIEKGNYALIPPGPIHKLAQIYAAGAVKYESRNWEKGINLSRFLDSAKRHLAQFQEGREDEDHITQALWNIVALSYTLDAIRNGLLPEELNDLPCYMPRDDPNPDEWRKENRLIDGYLSDSVPSSNIGEKDES